MNLQNPRFVLLAIGLLFFAPLLLAIMMRSSWWGFEPSNTANLGTLVQPPLALPAADLDVQYSLSPISTVEHRQWILMYPFPGQCGEQCQQDVAGLRQIHIATGRNRASVGVWLLSPATTNTDTQKKLVSLYPQFAILNDSSGTVAVVLDSTGGANRTGRDFWHSGQAFLIDPANNIILRYTPGFDPNDINQDLGRLLKWSGKE